MKKEKTTITLSEDNVKEIISDYLRNQGYAVKAEPTISLGLEFKGGSTYSTFKGIIVDVEK